MNEIGPVPQLRPAEEVDPAHIPALKAELERVMAEGDGSMNMALNEQDWGVLNRALRLSSVLPDRILTAQERRFLNLYGVKVTSDGPATPETTQVLDQLRMMIAGIEPEPEVLVVGPRRNRQQRRADARRIQS